MPIASAVTLLPLTNLPPHDTLVPISPLSLVTRVLVMVNYRLNLKEAQKKLATKCSGGKRERERERESGCCCQMKEVLCPIWCQVWCFLVLKTNTLVGSSCLIDGVFKLAIFSGVLLFWLYYGEQQQLDIPKIPVSKNHSIH